MSSVNRRLPPLNPGGVSLSLQRQMDDDVSRIDLTGVVLKLFQQRPVNSSVRRKTQQNRLTFDPTKVIGRRWIAADLYVELNSTGTKLRQTKLLSCMTAADEEFISSDVNYNERPGLI